MFIDFEGIDGSGKTTLSNRVADRLRAQGWEVVHAREGGELPSELARRIRALTRDGAGAALSAESELLLNAAREAQVLTEVVRPALARGAVVIADRSLHAHLAMALARGIPKERARAVLDVASGGTWANLVVLVDVDPDIARMRKRADKLEQEPEITGGRKGLAGLALLHRMRDALHAAAKAEPDRFVVVRNESEDLAALEEKIVAAVLARLSRRTPAPNRIAPQAMRRLPSTPPLEPAPLDERDPAALEATFLERVRRWAATDPIGAAMLLGGVDGEGAFALRRELATRAPAMVANSLTGIGDHALPLLESLAAAAPRSVAKALTFRGGDRADALRIRLACTHPKEVAASLLDRTDPFAWKLRERLWGFVPDAVLIGLAGDGSERAWRLREQAREAGVAPEAICASLARLDDERAWRWRAEIPVAPPVLLRSIRGCMAPQAWRIRSRWLEAAPRPVLKGMIGLDGEDAWALRHRAGSGAAEVLDSIAGMTGDAPRALRVALAPPFPSRALLSLPLVRDAADERFLYEVLARWGGHLLVLRAAIRVIRTGRLGEAAA